MYISSNKIKKSNTKIKKNYKNYFVVEKIIDLKKFKKKSKNYIFSTIGKNFNSSWKRDHQITICSLKTDPIKKLDKKNIYRIRFTAFSPDNLKFTIKIYSDCKIAFIKTLNTVK